MPACMRVQKSTHGPQRACITVQKPRATRSCHNTFCWDVFLLHYCCKLSGKTTCIFDKNTFGALRNGQKPIPFMKGLLPNYSAQAETPSCMSCFKMVDTLTGLVMASRRKGSPSSWLSTTSISVVSLRCIWPSTELFRAASSSSVV